MAQVKDLAPVILNRQSTFNIHLGLESDEAKANMDQQVLDLLAILEQHFEQHQFLLGFKPSVADFALFGPLKIHLYDDPQSNQILETQAPNTAEWFTSANHPPAADKHLLLGLSLLHIPRP